jgi:hypothetical protein
MNKILPTIITFLYSPNNKFKERILHFLQVDNDSCVLLLNKTKQKSEGSIKTFLISMVLLLFVSFANAASRYSVANGNWNAPSTWAVNEFGTTGSTGILTISCTVPTAYAMTGVGGTCTGANSDTAIGLANSETGVNYQLFHGPAAVGAAVSGTGAAISFGVHNSTGTYTVVATRTAGGCTATMTGSVMVIKYNTPVTPTATVADVTCPTDATGKITMTTPFSPASLKLYRSASPVGNGYVNLNKTLLSNRAAFTVEGWIKFDKTKAVSGMSIFGQNDVVEVIFEGTNLRVWTNHGAVNMPLSAFPADNSWHHIAATGDGKNVSLYFDGVLKGTSSGTTASYGSSSDTAKIGWAVSSPSGACLDGEVIKVGFWNRALSASEISTMSNGFAIYEASQSGLLAGYNFNEGAGTALASVGNTAAPGVITSYGADWTDPYTYSWTSTPAGFTSNLKNISGLSARTYNLTTALKNCTSAGTWEVKATTALPSTPVALPITPTCSSTLVINWNAVANATYYGLQVSESNTLSPAFSATLDGSTSIGNVSSYTVTGLKLNTTYYYKIWAYNGCGSTVSTSYTAVTGKGDAIWNGSAWSVVPTNQHNIVFAGKYPKGTAPAGENLEGCSCEVRPGVQVTIPEGKTLSLINGLIIDTAAGTSLTFENTASLWQENDAAVNTGKIVYKRKSSFMKDFDYTYWSSPVKGQNTKVLSPNTQPDKFYFFANNNWQSAVNVTMDLGRGYIIRTPKAGFVDNGVTVAFPYAQAVQFNGEPYNGDKIKFEVDPVLGRENLIGNPYPSALDANAFLLANQAVLEGTIYFWTHNTAIAMNTPNPGSGIYAYSSDDYAAYNSLGGVGGTPALSKPDPNNPVGSEKPSGKIAAGQSFMAITKAPGVVSFKNSMREKASNTQFFKQTKNAKTTAEGRQRVWLNLTNTQGAFKQTLIGYIKGATNSYEDFFDGISNNGNSFVDLYSINEGNNLVIQGRALPFDPTDVVPLGYSSKIEGTFAISIDQVDGDLSNQAIFIEDKDTQTIHDLKSGAYSFTTKIGIFNERFTLRYTDKTLGSGDFETTDNAVVVTVKNKQLKVHSAVDAIATVLVYDLSGRQLYKKERLNSNEVTVQYLTSGTQALVVKVVLENGKIVTKKVIY